MKDRFPGWNPATEEELHEYWVSGTVALDANVLLNAYRYSQSTRNDLLKAFEDLGERLWLPHRAAEEFHRNRLNVLIQQRLCGERLEADLSKAEAELTDALGKTMRELGRRDTESVRSAVEAQFKELKKKLKAADKEHHKGLGERKDHRDDPLYDRIVELLDGKVGDCFEAERLTEIRAAAEQRFQNNVPPGVGDADKEAERRHGDVIVWFQLIEKARESNGPIVFVTDDQKDWMWEVKGQQVGPKPALVAEMSKETGQAFHVYSTAQFVRVASKEGENVDEVVLQELETPRAFRDVEGDWFEEPETGRMIRLSRQRNAQGRQNVRVHPPYGGATAMPSGMRVPPAYSSEARATFSSDTPPETIATNSVAPGAVTLNLISLGGELDGRPIACDVLAPNGESHRSFVAATGTRGPGVQQASTIYPQAFPSASKELEAGAAYRVIWSVGDALEQVAADFFIVAPDMV
jgi:hypothetical protein